MSDSSRDDPSSGPESPGRGQPSGDETARALREVMKDQAERKARQEEATRQRRKNRLLPLPLVALFWTATCVIAWLWTPGFLRPEPLPEPTVAEVRTGLRVEMLSAMTRIERYREETGRLPESLDQVMEEPPANVLFVTFSSGIYRLRGRRAGTEIIYQSGDPLEELLGDAVQRIRGGGGREG